MKLKYAKRLYKFTLELSEGCQIQCPECKSWNSIEDWRETEVYCELCGTHDAIACPSCDIDYDHVYCDVIFGVKKEGNDD